jgi:hypothetical protein
MFARLFVSAFVGPMLLWLICIRPYCIRHGKGYTPGATWQTTMWVDWQEAKEIAAERKDAGMKWCCRLFVTGVCVFTLFILLAIIGSLF